MKSNYFKISNSKTYLFNEITHWNLQRDLQFVADRLYLGAFGFAQLIKAIWFHYPMHAQLRSASKSLI